MNDPAGKMKVARLVTFLAWGGRTKLLIAPLLGERGRLAALSAALGPSRGRRSIGPWPATAQVPADATPLALRLLFDRPVWGPLALGFGAHFGLGLLAPADHLLDEGLWG